MVYIFKYNPSGEPLGPSAPLKQAVSAWTLSVAKEYEEYDGDLAVLPCTYNLMSFSFLYRNISC